MGGTRIALVSGANRGLGLETSRQLAKLGIKVLIGARDPAKGNQAADTLRSEGLNVEAVQLDVTDSSHIQAVTDYITDNYGRLDILINNAGMAHPDEPLFCSSAPTVSMAVLRRTFDVNFFGLVELTQSLLPLIKKSKQGRIVNVSSMLGSLNLHSMPGAGLEQIKPFAYDASKTAVNQFTVHLAASLKHTPVKVNSAHPGWVKTELGGKEAPMEVEEGVLTAVKLATLDSDGPTGKFFHMDEEMPW
jgi:NAD(P)-dependent dehydrogenase (short-subunit alcohol dehydrogenase family)